MAEENNNSAWLMDKLDKAISTSKDVIDQIIEHRFPTDQFEKISHVTNLISLPLGLTLGYFSARAEGLPHREAVEKVYFPLAAATLAQQQVDWPVR